MLFDLRGPGRRRAVKVIYVTLAVLMGGGLVFFGIGGSVSGGLFDAIGLTNSGGGGGGGGNDLLEKQEKAAQRRVKANPSDAAAWATLARLHYQQAGQGDNYDQNRGVFKSGGRRELGQAATAWERYLQLEKKPDPSVAAYMVQAYLNGGLKPSPAGVQAGEIMASAQPSAQTYFNFAALAYSAGQARKGDLAAAKALAKTPAADRPAVKSQLESIKKDGGLPKGSAPSG